MIGILMTLSSSLFLIMLLKQSEKLVEFERLSLIFKRKSGVIVKCTAYQQRWLMPLISCGNTLKFEKRMCYSI